MIFLFTQSKDGNQSAPKLLAFFDNSLERHVNASRAEHEVLSIKEDILYLKISGLSDIQFEMLLFLKANE